MKTLFFVAGPLRICLCAPASLELIILTAKVHEREIPENITDQTIYAKLGEKDES